MILLLAMNKGILIPVVASIILLGTLGSGIILDDAFAKQEKVTICHKPGTPAEQTLEIAAPAVPAHLAHGDYEGECVVDPPVGDPNIDPDCGPGGTAFTITDPQGRMVPSLGLGPMEIIFYEGGSGPEAGTFATNVVINADGTIATGNVPTTLAPGIQYFVTVREDPPLPSVFADLGFFVSLSSADCPSNDPSFTPRCGFAGTPFTITDPQGRIETGDVAIFYPEGTAPDAGTLATDVVISADGTTLTGTVPGSLAGGQHFVSVSSGVASPSRFVDLSFHVGCPAPSIDPTTTFTGLPFTITDPQGRIQPGSIALFYVEGSAPELGTPADNVSISGCDVNGCTTLDGTVPGSLATAQHFVSVRQSIGEDSYFADLAFMPL